MLDDQDAGNGLVGTGCSTARAMLSFESALSSSRRLRAAGVSGEEAGLMSDVRNQMSRRPSDRKHHGGKVAGVSFVVVLCRTRPPSGSLTARGAASQKCSRWGERSGNKRRRGSDGLLIRADGTE